MNLLLNTIQINVCCVEAQGNVHFLASYASQGISRGKYWRKSPFNVPLIASYCCLSIHTSTIRFQIILHGALSVFIFEYFFQQLVAKSHQFSKLCSFFALKLGPFAAKGVHFRPKVRPFLLISNGRFSKLFKSISDSKRTWCLRVQGWVFSYCTVTN